MRAVALTADFVETIHDELVGLYFPHLEPVSSRDFRDRAALEAAVAAPHAVAFGEEQFPTAQAKAARMFYGLAANHPFSNGNKRTALVAADLFCYANGFNLAMARRTSVWAARMAASHNSHGMSYPEAFRRLLRIFGRDMVSFAAIKPAAPRLYRDCLLMRRWVRAAQRPQR